MTVEEITKKVEELKNGDSSAYEALYNEFYEPLRFYIAKRIGSVEEADDLTQDSFLTVMEKIDSLKEPAAFKTWLYQIANNKTNDHFRLRSHIADFDTDESLEAAIEQAEEYSEPMCIPSDYLENEETQKEIREAIDTLSYQRRSALIMFYYENMRIKDIAKAMGVNENAVNHRLSEARKQIAKKLEKLAKGNYVCVPLPLVLQALAKANGEKGAAAFSVTTGGAAVTGTMTAKLIAVGASAVLIGGTVLMSKFIGDPKLGKIRLRDQSAVDSLTDSSVTTTYVTGTSRVTTAADESSQTTTMGGGDAAVTTTSRSGTARTTTAAPAVPGAPVQTVVNNETSPEEQAPDEEENTREENFTENNTENYPSNNTGNSTGNSSTAIATTRATARATSADTAPEQTDPQPQEPTDEPADKSLSELQRSLVDKLYDESDDYYQRELADRVTSDPFEDSYSYENIGFAEFPNLDRKWTLPAGGYLFYSASNSDPVEDGVYTYVYPTKHITDERNGNDIYVTPYVSFGYAFDSLEGLTDSDKGYGRLANPYVNTKMVPKETDPYEDTILSKDQWTTESYHMDIVIDHFVLDHFEKNFTYRESESITTSKASSDWKYIFDGVFYQTGSDKELLTRECLVLEDIPITDHMGEYIEENPDKVRFLERKFHGWAYYDDQFQVY